MVRSVKTTGILLMAFWMLAVSAAGGFASAGEEAGWEEKLKAADGVIRVEKIEDFESQLFTEKYLVTFEQPLDWSDPSRGTFPQRVEVGLRDDAQINVLETNGYYLMDQQMGPFGLAEDPDTELPGIFDANYFNVESRFFGESRPADMSNDDVKYWEYDTAENAAHDYHRIYTTLAALTGQDWIATGVSRGGQLTNVYGYFFPDDMLVYVPYVAPCSQGPEDPRYYRFLYTGIGDEVYGEEQAKAYRDLMTDFQVELMRNKESLLPDFEVQALDNGTVYRPGVTMGQLYDLCVMEFAGVFWQYQTTPFEELQTILDMPETTLTQRQTKQETELKMLLSRQRPTDFCSSSYAWPYYVSAATTYGQYHYDFSYLRDALKAEGLEDTLSVAEDMETGILWRTVFTEEQLEAFTFDSSFRDALEDSMKTTTAKYLMIFGAADPWISVRIPDTDNPNVKVFVHPARSHTATISSMPGEMKAEIMAVLKNWINMDPHDMTNNTGD